jgi:hypothetical protein
VTNATPASVNRIVCYCDDCQAYAHWLRRAELLDAHGGSDIVQVAPASLRFEHGQEHIRALRLGPKGLYRWHASCCNTPVGNTVVPSIPFVGILAQTLVGGPPRVTEVVGPPRGAVLGKFALGELPAEATRFNPRLLLGIAARLLRWRLSGQTWPHPFFDRETRSPRFPITTLSATERESLRPLCGPQPLAINTRRSD